METIDAMVRAKRRSSITSLWEVELMETNPIARLNRLLTTTSLPSGKWN